MWGEQAIESWREHWQRDMLVHYLGEPGEERARGVRTTVSHAVAGARRTAIKQA